MPWKVCLPCAVLVLKSVIPLIIPAASIKHVVVAPDCIIWRGLPPNLHARAYTNLRNPAEYNEIYRKTPTNTT